LYFEVTSHFFGKGGYFAGGKLNVAIVCSTWKD